MKNSASAATPSPARQTRREVPQIVRVLVSNGLLSEVVSAACLAHKEVAAVARLEEQLDKIGLKLLWEKRSDAHRQEMCAKLTASALKKLRESPTSKSAPIKVPQVSDSSVHEQSPAARMSSKAPTRAKKLTPPLTVETTTSSAEGTAIQPSSPPLATEVTSTENAGTMAESRAEAEPVVKHTPDPAPTPIRSESEPGPVLDDGFLPDADVVLDEEVPDNDADPARDTEDAGVPEIVRKLVAQNLLSKAVAEACRVQTDVNAVKKLVEELGRAGTRLMNAARSEDERRSDCEKLTKYALNMLGPSPASDPTPVETEPGAEEVVVPPSPTSGAPDPVANGDGPPAHPPEPVTKQASSAATEPTTTLPVAPAATLMPTWIDRIEQVDPGVLSDHPLWADIAGPEAPEREEELADDVRAGQLMPTLVMITGARCASPPDTILSGHRYVHAVTATRGRVVMVVRRTDLDRDAEEILLVKSALGSRHARQLTQSKLAALEARLHAIYARPSGFRSDLETWVGSNAGSVAGRTVDLVASVTKEPRNAIANRKKVFGSAISHLALRDAIDQGRIALTTGADLIRDIESEPEVAEVLKRSKEQAWTDDTVSQDNVVQAARARVEGRVRELTGKPKHKPTKTNDGDDNKLVTVEAPGRTEGDAVVLDCMFRSRKTRVTVMDRVIRIEDLGREANRKRQDGR